MPGRTIKGIEKEYGRKEGGKGMKGTVKKRKGVKGVSQHGGHGGGNEEKIADRTKR
jgi:hypothetical protein